MGLLTDKTCKKMKSVLSIKNKRGFVIQFDCLKEALILKILFTKMYTHKKKGCLKDSPFFYIIL